MTRFFKRHWEESRGDAHDSWGPSTWYFEVGADGSPVRQVELYDDGPTLRYGPDHPEDQFGGLGQVRIDDLEDWSEWLTTPEEFEKAWSATP